MQTFKMVAFFVVLVLCLAFAAGAVVVGVTTQSWAAAMFLGFCAVFAGIGAGSVYTSIVGEDKVGDARKKGRAHGLIP